MKEDKERRGPPPAAEAEGDNCDSIEEPTEDFDVKEFCEKEVRIENFFNVSYFFLQN